MTYKELLALYRTGGLDEVQRRQVEADIEKQEAISDYLWEQEEMPGLEDTAPDAEAEAARAGELTAAIQKSIRRAFIKLGVTVGAAVLAIALCAIFVLPHVVDRFYYNPTEIVGTNPESEHLTTDRMSLDLAVWSELFLPGRYRNNVTAIPRGYGAYDISIQQNASADGHFTTLNGRLVRDELQLYSGDVLRRPAGNAFFLPEGCKTYNRSIYVDADGNELPQNRAQERAQSFDFLRNRPNNDLLIAYISLENLTDYDAFYRWYQSIENGHDVYDAWAGVYAEDENGNWATENTGFNLSASGMCLDWDRERYPLLSRLDNQDPNWDAENDEALMTTHFLSLLTYLEDHPELTDIFLSYPSGLDVESTRAYVETNGLQIYGLAMVASRDTLLQLEDDPAVSYISTTPY